MRKLLFVIMLALSFEGKAQEPQYSQFYSSYLYLNPAFAGNTGGNRVGLNYRNQWPAIPGVFTSYSMSYDVKLTGFNSGLGLYTHRDNAGSGGLRYTNFGTAYNYTIHVNRRFAIRPALGIGYSIRDVDPTKLTFSDQLITGLDQSYVTGLFLERSTFVDINAGALAFGEDFWVGYSVYHLNNPNNSLLERQSNFSARHSVHGGYRFVLQRGPKKSIKTSVTLVSHYKAHREWDQLDLGGYFFYEMFNFGVWYRGLPFVKGYLPGYPNNESVVLLTGIRHNGLRFGYSYDITVSGLWSSSGGAHEISLSYQWRNDKKRRKRVRMVPCPEF